MPIKSYGGKHLAGGGGVVLTPVGIKRVKTNPIWDSTLLEVLDLPSSKTSFDPSEAF